MPFKLKRIEITNQFKESSSVLIVACNVCSRVSLAVDNRKPCFSLTHCMTGKDFFISYIKGVQKSLTQKNIRSGVFNSFFPAPMMCMWLKSQREKLSRCVSGYDAIAIFGCESAVATVKDSVKGFNGAIVQMMSVEGLSNIIPSIRFPFSIELKPSAAGIIPLPEKNPEQLDRCGI